MLGSPLLLGPRRGGVGVLPLLLVRMPPVEREVRGQTVLRGQFPHHPVRLVRAVLAARVQEDAGAIGADRDPAAEPATHVVFDLVLAH